MRSKTRVGGGGGLLRESGCVLLTAGSVPFSSVFCIPGTKLRNFFVCFVQKKEWLDTTIAGLCAKSHACMLLLEKITAARKD